MSKLELRVHPTTPGPNESRIIEMPKGGRYKRVAVFKGIELHTVTEREMADYQKDFGPETLALFLPEAEQSFELHEIVEPNRWANPKHGWRDARVGNITRYIEHLEEHGDNVEMMTDVVEILRDWRDMHREHEELRGDVDHAVQGGLGILAADPLAAIHKFGSSTRKHVDDLEDRVARAEEHVIAAARILSESKTDGTIDFPDLSKVVYEPIFDKNGDPLPVKNAELLAASVARKITRVHDVPTATELPEVAEERAWTVGELRKSLEGVPDDLPCIVEVLYVDESEQEGDQIMGALVWAPSDESRCDGQRCLYITGDATVMPDEVEGDLE
jgi:hypothetical protein